MKLSVKALESLKRNALFAKVTPTEPDTLAWIKIIRVGKPDRKYLIVHVEFEVALVELAYKYQEHLDHNQARRFDEIDAKDDDDLARIISQWISHADELFPPWRIEIPF